MTKEELIKVAIAYAVEHVDDMPQWADSMGIRYDNKIVQVGEELNDSKTNYGRDDARDFPQFGDDDYDDLESLGGVSCYHLADRYDDIDDIKNQHFFEECLSGSKEAQWDHCSIIIGQKTDNYCEDSGEAILGRAEVVKILW